MEPYGLPEVKGKVEVFRSDSFALLKSSTWDEGISFDENWVRHFFVIHKKPPTFPNLQFKLKVCTKLPNTCILILLKPTGLPLIENAEGMLSFYTPTGETGLIVSTNFFRNLRIFVDEISCASQ